MQSRESSAAGWLLPRLHIDHLWLALPAALVVWRGLLQPIRLLDFWWHLKAGEVIVTSGSIPRRDLFSFTAVDSASVPHCWLAQSLYYLGYSFGGLPSLIVLNTVLILVAFLLVYCVCLETAASLRVGIASAFLAAGSLALYSGMRPHVFSFVLLAYMYWAVTGFRRRRRDWLWTLPLSMALWVNLHGAFAIGIGLFAVFLGCEATRRLVSGPRPELLSRRELGKLGLIFILTCLAMLASPEGYKILGFVQRFATNQYDFVLEWQAPRINSVEGILLFHGPFFVTLLVLLWSRERPDATELGLFVSFAALGLTSYRNGVWFSLIAAPIVARHLSSVPLRDYLAPLGRFPSIAALGRVMSRFEDQPGSAPRHYLNASIALTMMAITVIVSPWVYPYLGLRSSNLLEKETPVGAMDYMANHGLEGHTFHPQIYGDYLIWRLWPKQRSFFNSQVHLFGSALFEDYALMFVDRHWPERLERYDIRFLLLRKSADDNQMMIAGARDSDDWRVLYEDDLSILFEKR